MEHSTEVFVGIDVAKARNAIAVADGERGGEVRLLGEVDASTESMRRLINRIAAKYDRVHFCYEAGPTGYGLYRLITTLGHSCSVVAPSLIPSKPGDRVKTNPPRCGRPRQAPAGRRTHRCVGARRDPRGDARPHSGPRSCRRDLARASAAGERFHAQTRSYIPAENDMGRSATTLAAGAKVRTSRPPDRFAGDGRCCSDLERTRRTT